VDEPRAALALDIGGTKLAAGVVDPGGRLVTWARTPTPAGLDAEQLWRTLDALFTGVLDKAGITDPSLLAGVGCGCGGPMEWPAGVVSPLNMPAWRAFPLRDRLAERLPGLPVRVHNDAICVAAAEHWRGAGRGRASMLGMVVSTGVGGGLILDGKLVNGAKLQNIAAFAMDLMEQGGVVTDPDLAPLAAVFQQTLMTSPSSRIAGGSDEIMRNIIAERVLGLPPDIRVDKDLPFNKLPTGKA